MTAPTTPTADELRARLFKLVMLLGAADDSCAFCDDPPKRVLRIERPRWRFDVDVDGNEHAARGVQCVAARDAPRPGLLTLQHRLLLLLRAAGQRGTCRGCGGDVWWIEHAGGRRAPYTAAGLNHFADCPKASAFRTRRNP